MPPTLIARLRALLRLHTRLAWAGAFVPFTAATRMSGVNVAATQLRKGAADAIGPGLVRALTAVLQTTDD